MSQKIYHFALDVQGEVCHSYYTSLEGLILDQWEDLTVSRSTLQKAFAEKGRLSYSHENWTIFRGNAVTTKEARAYREALDETTPEDFETDLNDQ